MKELNFINIIVKYEEEILSDKQIKKMKMVEGLFTVLSLFIAFSALSFGSVFLDIENHFILSMIITILFCLAFVGAGLVFLLEIYKKIVPPYYEFIAFLENYKTDEIKVIWENNQYYIYLKRKRWENTPLEKFIGITKKPYLLEDKIDKEKPFTMIIRLYKNNVEILVENI